MTDTPSEAPHSGIVEKLRKIVEEHSSPTVGRGFHEGQRGNIIYADDGWPFIEARWAQVLTSPVEGLEYETTAATRSRLSMSVDRDMHNDVRALLRDFDRQSAHIATLTAALTAEKERADALHDLAKKIGKALLRFTPDGSEYYVKVHDDYYADAEACQRIAQRTLDNQHETIKTWVRRAKDAEAARVKAEGALRVLAHDWENGWSKETRADTIRAVEKIARAALGETP